MSTVNTVSHRNPPFVINGITATGTTQATAFGLTNSTYHEFTTVASGSGAILPIPFIPSPVTIYNNTATALLVYPPVGGTIDSGTVNAAISLAAGTGVQYWASSSTNWYNTQTAGSVTSTVAATRSLINIVGAGTAVANTAVSTSLFTGATFRSGQSLTFPANSLVAGQAIRLCLSGTWGTTGGSGTPTIAFSLLLGGNTIAISFPYAPTTATTNGSWSFIENPIIINIPTIGASGACFAEGSYVFVNNSASAAGGRLVNGNNDVVGTGTLNTINTTGALALDLQAVWNVASATNTIQLTAGFIELIG
jgi:hypothetical protein